MLKTVVKWGFFTSWLRRGVGNWFETVVKCTFWGGLVPRGVDSGVCFCMCVFCMFSCVCVFCVCFLSVFFCVFSLCFSVCFLSVFSVCVFCLCFLCVRVCFLCVFCVRVYLYVFSVFFCVCVCVFSVCVSVRVFLSVFSVCFSVYVFSVCFLRVFSLCFSVCFLCVCFLCVCVCVLSVFSACVFCLCFSVCFLFVVSVCVFLCVVLCVCVFSVCFCVCVCVSVCGFLCVCFSVCFLSVFSLCFLSVFSLCVFSVCLSACVFLCVFLCVFCVCVRVSFLCVFWCVFICVFSLCVFSVCFSVCACAFFVFYCVFVSVFSHVRFCACVSLFVLFCVCMFLYVFLCMCVFMCVPVPQKRAAHEMIEETPSKKFAPAFVVQWPIFVSKISMFCLSVEVRWSVANTAIKLKLLNLYDEIFEFVVLLGWVVRDSIAAWYVICWVELSVARLLQDAWRDGDQKKHCLEEGCVLRWVQLQWMFVVFLEFILEFIHMYARCGHAGTWRAPTQRLADTTPWREKNGDATFAGFKFWFVSEKIMSTFAGCFCCWSSHGIIARKIYVIAWCHRKEDISRCKCIVLFIVCKFSLCTLCWS